MEAFVGGMGCDSAGNPLGGLVDGFLDRARVAEQMGEGMAMNLGVTATFMSALANANVNIRLIAQVGRDQIRSGLGFGFPTFRALRRASTLHSDAAEISDTIPRQRTPTNANER